VFPELIHIGSFALPAYGVLVAIGVTAGLFVSARMGQQQGLSRERIWDLGVFVVLAAIAPRSC